MPFADGHCIVYSMGVNDDWTFDKEASDRYSATCIVQCSVPSAVQYSAMSLSFQFRTTKSRSYFATLLS